ncbi:Lipopolysaccharide biosynthesis protein, LPS:glycosyltransferase [Palleronia marisminoris]|uniref:Glycosyl transferase family 8 n=1 Tax=Palleronia marisminoris TaxID=315423 RepID=A0A1Y5SLL8_9RHOB|nr:glycosyltransferase [Palleronia marisminoris]SFG88678.1 Lipopolysaccharide biosynthesis protein, LPS:glycosyltransferase [Palleronia marisminoris]SLN43588.1 Glycosyl transferase family 8 [Palleronia marisminoris]
MTIRNLAARGLVDTAAAGTQETGRRALAFVLDRSFLHPFKVLIYSLARTGSFLDLPILVFTQDKVVHDDPIVTALADRRIHVTDEQIRQFSVVSRERIRRKDRRSWIAKYTFLKWLIFDDHDVDEMLFIDADILCLQNADGIFDEPRGRDLGVCPRMRPSLYRTDEDTRRPAAEVTALMAGMVRGEFPKDHVSMNSGVMILANRCLDAGFRERLLELASQKSLPNEQAYLTELFASDENYDARFLPSKYNFTSTSLSKMPAPDQVSLLAQVAFLHFTGGKKPWTWPLTSQSPLGHMLWRRFEADAVKNSALIPRQRSWIAARLSERFSG